ncbi:MAG: hypothetical protein AAGA58_06700 [Verrucomicrobiota bacterium]
MELDRAKEILMSIDTQDPPRQEPGVEEALSLAESDAELQSWLESEQSLDAAMNERLQSVEIPAGLRDQLLSTVASAKPEGGKIIGFPPVLLAAAAAVVLLGIIGISNMFFGGNSIEQTGPISFASFQNTMADMTHSRSVNLTHYNKDFTNLQNWVDENGGPSTPSCEKLAAKKSNGCAFIEWGDQKVAVFCIDADKDKRVHMFVLDRNEFPSLPSDEEMKSVARKNGLETAGWADEESVYIVVGQDEETRVSDFF